VFPRARFVHVVRDGRAVANSLLQVPWWHGYHGTQTWRLGPLAREDHDMWLAHERSFVALAGLNWKILIDAFQRAEKAIDPDRWRTIRYEDLVAEPRRTVEDLLEWFGMAPSRIFTRRLEHQPFRSGRTHAYRRDLTMTQVRVLEQVMRGQLQHHGYSIDAEWFEGEGERKRAGGRGSQGHRRER
jgi:hypothetical protein